MVHLRKAAVEAIASHTVGIAVLDNTAIGTGTLVSYLGKRYVLTAKHVIAGAAIETIRFWPRPPRAMIEKAAKDATDADYGRETVGVLFPVAAYSTSSEADIALLEIDARFELAAGAEFYDLSRSAPFGDWRPEGLDALLLLIFGYPTENSRPLRRVGNMEQRFLGATAFESRYFAESNEPEKWKGLPYQLDPAKDFLFDYPQPIEDAMHPRGFSGCGVWVPCDIPGRPVWTSEPVLLGVTHTYLKSRGLIAATQMPVIFSVLRDHVLGGSFTGEVGAGN